MQRGRSILRALSSGWMLLGIMMALQLAQVPVALMFLSKEEFGLFAVLTQLLANLALIDLGVGVAVGRLMIDARVEGEAAVSRLWSSAACVFACQAAILGLATLICAPFIPVMFHVPEHLVKESQYVFVALGFLATLTYFIKLSSLALFAAQRVTTTNVVPAISAILQFGVFYAAASSGYRIWALVIASAVANIATGAMFRWLAKREGVTSRFRRDAVDKVTIFHVLKMALELYIFGFFNTLIQNSLLVFGAFRLPLGVIAALTANAKLLQVCAQIVHRVPSSAEPYLMNLIARGDLARFRFGWLFICRVAPAVAIIAGGILHIFTAHFIRWWTEPGMMLPAAVIVWMAMMPVRQALHYLLVSSLVMFKEVQAVRFALMREVVIYALLALLLPGWWGITGLIIANLASCLCGAIWTGARRICVLAEIPGGELAAALAHAVIPGIIAGALLVIALPDPSTRALPGIFGIGAVWATVSLAALWCITLGPAERKHVLRALGRQAHDSGVV